MDIIIWQHIIRITETKTKSEKNLAFLIRIQTKCSSREWTTSEVLEQTSKVPTNTGTNKDTAEKTVI